VAVRELFVVETKQVKDGGVKIMNVDTTFDPIKAKLVGLTMDMARLHSTTG
jgi:hypothetical protein